MIRRLLNSQAGVTLIELIVSIVVISVALGGVLMVMNFTTSHSADPVLRHQAIAIAEAYMEEVTLKAYFDPDDGLLCPAKEANRDQYDNICDFNGLSNSGAEDQTGSPIAGLGNYAVAISVSSQDFGSPVVSGLKIDVTVTDPANEALTLTGYRANY